MSQPINPVVCGLSSHMTASPVIYTGLQRWKYGRFRPDSLALEWRLDGTYRVEGTRFKALEPQVPGSYRSHSGSCLVLVQIYDTPNGPLDVSTVLDVRAPGVPANTHDPKAMLPHWDALKLAIYEWGVDTFAPKPAPDLAAQHGLCDKDGIPL